MDRTSDPEHRGLSDTFDRVGYAALVGTAAETRTIQRSRKAVSRLSVWTAMIGLISARRIAVIQTIFNLVGLQALSLR